MNITLDQNWIEAFLLASVRMVAFLVIAPPFSYNAFPARVKAMLGLGLALAVAPQVSQGYSALGTGAFFMALVLELLVGALLGFLVLVVFSAVQSAGNLIDTFGGFQLAQAFDPQSMVNGAQFTRVFQITALALLFASDGYQLIIGGLLRSFTALPLTGGVDLSEPAAAMVTAVSQMFLAAVQIAGPLLVVLFLADAGLGLLTRVAPALNAFALGFPLKILLTLTLASMVFLALPRIVSSLVSTIVRAVTGVE
ncbi:flagellar biosynthetic protein FliR [Arthrobacter zhangbolii]|uniref:Flagellar biosynthetic protein FliR n=1 Tax=Arthrobacter zhangbolii TaxID=2886936 RepID=A0A9X1MBD6_9MICC|nr:MULTISPECIES: flagellar biosynthetic protein FliR [Arthrobacter]MCC3273724.1 flagellar biosynthetic protein FliR [Arthrobacter zhangbolii]MCC3295788.1 flagellar biosynthetic protein FliR [Arthrobacter zhangbolii]MDN3906005.1 flagellar biosynthetic protein FliR [Arthrobacter sp. YD2]UON92526.1 flagellar biosynthetic protein FliR [Arthrobacter zhangbolii]